MPDTKALSSLTADIKAVKEPEADTYTITLSVPEVDRDGEVVDAKAFDPLPSWLNIDIDHGMSVLTTVGSGEPVYEGETLMLRGFSFASTPLGQEVKTLVDEGHIRKMSVAFMSAERETDEKDGLPHIRKAELLNAAIVAIPSLRQADILTAAKSLCPKCAAEAPTVTVEIDGREVGKAAQIPTSNDEPAAAPAPATPPVDMSVVKAQVLCAEAALLLA